MATNDHYTTCSHDGTNFNIVACSTTEWSFATDVTTSSYNSPYMWITVPNDSSDKKDPLDIMKDRFNQLHNQFFGKPLTDLRVVSMPMNIKPKKATILPPVLRNIKDAFNGAHDRFFC